MSTAETTTPKWKDVYEAATESDFEAVKYFVEQRDSVLRFTNEQEKSVPLIAAVNNNFQILKYTLEKDDSLLMNGDLFGNNIMQRTIEHGNLNTVKYLIEHHKWPIDKRNNRYFGNTPIHHAAEEGQLEILKYFIEELGGDVNIRNNLGDPPIFVAAEKPYMNTLKYLIEDRHADVTAVNNNQENILWVSAIRGELTVPRYLLDEKKIPFDINWRDQFNYTALYMAARHNKLKFVEYLVNTKHADVNLVDGEHKKGPLHVAAFRNNIPICQFLVQHGADLEARDSFGNTPVECATDENLIQYFKTVHAHKRNRRSADVHFENPPALRPNWLNWLVSEYSSQARGLLAGSSETPRLGDISGGKLDEFLVVADTIFRYAKGSSNQPRDNQEALLSPREMLQNKMDPMAVDAVESEPK